MASTIRPLVTVVEERYHVYEGTALWLAQRTRLTSLCIFFVNAIIMTRRPLPPPPHTPKQN